MRSSRSSAKARASRRCGSASGERIACGAFVERRGRVGRARRSPRGSGFEIPVHSRKRCVFVFERQAALARLPARDRYDRRLFPPGGESTFCGVSPPEDRGPRQRRFRGRSGRNSRRCIWPALAHRVPALREPPLGARLGGPLRPQHLRPQRDRRPRARPRQRLSRRRLFRPWHPAIAGGRARASPN